MIRLVPRVVSLLSLASILWLAAAPALAQNVAPPPTGMPFRYGLGHEQYQDHPCQSDQIEPGQPDISLFFESILVQQYDPVFVGQLLKQLPIFPFRLFAHRRRLP